MLKEKPFLNKLREPVSIFILALSVRFFFLFFVFPTDFAVDSYHRWQIADYTLHIGLQHGRMWDLGGMEYFWLPLPQLVNAFLMGLFKINTLIPFRSFNAILGSLTVILIYLVARKYFSSKFVNITATVLVALNPLLAFHDVTGLSETMGIFFIVLALLKYEKSAYWTGFSLALASLCRIEFWLLTLGICVCYLVFERNGVKFLSAVWGFLTIMIPYFFHVKTVTGNPFYALYWNFFGSVVGVWGHQFIIPSYIRLLFFIVLTGAVIGLIALIKKRVKGYVVYASFFGFALYHGLWYTFVSRGVLWNRLFMLDVTIGAILLGLLIYRLPKRKAMVLIIIAVTILLLIYFTPIYSKKQDEITYIFNGADWLGSRYQGGTIICGSPRIVYRLISKWHIPNKNILSSLYLPHENRTATFIWLQENNVTWYICTSLGWDDTIKLFPELIVAEDHPPFYLKAIFIEYWPKILIYEFNRTLFTFFDLRSAINYMPALSSYNVNLSENASIHSAYPYYTQKNLANMSFLEGA